MAGTKRMTTEQVVGDLIEGEGLDFLRESLLWVVPQLMEAESSMPVRVATCSGLTPNCAGVPRRRITGVDEKSRGRHSGRGSANDRARTGLLC